MVWFPDCWGRGASGQRRDTEALEDPIDRIWQTGQPNCPNFLQILHELPILLIFAPF